MPLDPKRVQAVFLAAAECHAAADRAAVLDRECSSDTDLRERVDVLLRAHDRSIPFLNQPLVNLKPGNILLAADGTPKITDFGLAKSLAADSGLTRTDSIMGSPGYMAPEQAEGKAKQVGPLADVYAMGAILYELLTGGPPFRGTTALEILDQVKNAEPVPPSRLVPGLPRNVETIALKCLQKVRRTAAEASQLEAIKQSKIADANFARAQGR